MIPYPYNMVDMGGIDLAEANGTVVEGLYSKIVEAVNSCGDAVLYNWRFAGIEIAPQHTQILLRSDALTINTLIQVTEQDVVTVLGIAPPPPPIVPVEPLIVRENGVYEATPPASGFNPVTVEVQSSPVYTNTPAGYNPYYVEVSAGGTLATVGTTVFTKFNSTPVYGAFMKSTSNAGAILLTLPENASVQNDVRFGPNYVEYGTTVVDGTSWRWAITTGISSNYISGLLVFDSTTGNSWTNMRNDLVAKIARYTPPEFPVYRVSGKGLILAPEGYSGFGPLYIN